MSNYGTSPSCQVIIQCQDLTEKAPQERDRQRDGAVDGARLLKKQ